MIAATLALGVKSHLVSRNEDIRVRKLASMINFRGHLRDNVFNRYNRLLKIMKVQETKVSSLECHAWLPVHTWQ